MRTAAAPALFGRELARVEVDRRALRMAAAREVQGRMDTYFEALARQERSGAPAALVDTQSIDIPAHDWDNEIHPDGAGFNRVVDRFEAAIRKRFGS